MFNIKSNLLIRSFLLGLTCVSSLFAVAWPAGTKYVIPVTINHLKVGGALTNYPVRLDCSSLLTSDVKFKTNISTVNNICVYDAVAGLLRPKGASIDLANNKMYLGFDAAVSSTVDKIYFICVGQNINVINSAQAFTNSNVINHWDLNEAVGSTTVQDKAGGATGTVSNVVMGASGISGNSGDFAGNANARITTTATIPNQITVEIIVYYVSYLANRTDLLTNWGSSNGTIFIVNSLGQLAIYNGGFITGTSQSLTPNSWNHIVATRSATGVVNAWLNNTKVVDNIQGNLGQGSTTNIGARSTSAYSYNNKIDEVSICSDVKSIECVSTSYENMMNPTTFRTFGAGFSVGSGGRALLQRIGNYIGIGL